MILVAKKKLVEINNKNACNNENIPLNESQNSH